MLLEYTRDKSTRQRRDTFEGLQKCKSSLSLLQSLFSLRVVPLHEAPGSITSSASKGLPKKDTSRGFALAPNSGLFLASIQPTQDSKKCPLPGAVSRPETP